MANKRKAPVQHGPTDLEYVQKPGLWPRWPILPMVGRSGTSKEWEVGVLFADKGIVVYHVSMFDLGSPNPTTGKKPTSYKEAFDNHPKSTYPTWEALLAEWRID